MHIPQNTMASARFYRYTYSPFTEPLFDRRSYGLLRIAAICLPQLSHASTVPSSASPCEVPAAMLMVGLRTKRVNLSSPTLWPN